jgi:hypothetical protein
MALLDNNKDVLPLASIAEILNAKIRTPKKKDSKKLYSISDIKIVAFVHYLASVKKINANGIKYIIEMLNTNMDEKNREEFLVTVEEKMEKISTSDINEVEII